MHEINKRTTGTLSAMQPDLEYIPVCSDPRGIYLSEMYEEDPEPEETSDYGMSSSLGMSRSTGSNGGGCVTAATMALTKDYTVPLQGYGYDDAKYEYQGFLIAIQLI